MESSIVCSMSILSSRFIHAVAYERIFLSFKTNIHCMFILYLVYPFMHVAGASYVCSSPCPENSPCLPPGPSQSFMNVPQIPHFTAVGVPTAAAAFPHCCASQQSRRAAPAQTTSDTSDSGLHRLHPTWRGDLFLSDLILT